MIQTLTGFAAMCPSLVAPASSRHCFSAAAKMAALLTRSVGGRRCHASQPQLEVYQSPQLLLTVAHTVEVLADKVLCVSAIEIVAGPRARAKEEVLHERLKGCAKPRAYGYGEASLVAVKHVSLQARPQRLLQQDLGAKSSCQHLPGDAGREF